MSRVVAMYDLISLVCTQHKPLKHVAVISELTSSRTSRKLMAHRDALTCMSYHAPLSWEWQLPSAPYCVLVYFFYALPVTRGKW